MFYIQSVHLIYHQLSRYSLNLFLHNKNLPDFSIG
nr:MAG TPA: hypothetical protein [Caudoviricetes sp.]